MEREERTYPQGEGKGDVKLLNTLLFAPQHDPFSYVPYLEYRVGLGLGEGENGEKRDGSDQS